MFNLHFKTAAAAAIVATTVSAAEAHYSELSEKVRAEHASFLATMMGQCCYGHEVVSNIEQIYSAAGGYTVVVPPMSYPGQEDKKIVYFAPQKIKTREEIEEACRSIYAGNEEELKTCTPVPVEMNIAFMHPDTFQPYCFLPKFNLG